MDEHPDGDDEQEHDDRTQFERAADHQGNVTAAYLRMRKDELGNAGPHNF